jgi:hypothetical protein
VTAHSGRGQGDQPLYEGVVLPANGEPWTPEQQRQAAQSQTQPSAGHPWGEPWGPESQAAVMSGQNSAPSLPPPPPQAPPAPPVIPPQQHALPGNDEWAGVTSGDRPVGGETMRQPAGLPPLDQPQHLDEPQPPFQAPAPDGALPPGPAPAPVSTPHAPQNGHAYYGDAQLPPQQPQQPQQPQPLAGQAAPPVSASDATQYIPPVTDASAPGALMPGAPMPSTFGPGAAMPGPHQPGGLPPMADADATQMLPPQTGQAPPPGATTPLRSPLPPETQDGGATANEQRQPPAGFESLYRAEPGGDGQTGATQSLSLFDQAVARQRPGGVGGLGSPGGPPAPTSPYGPSGAQTGENGQPELQGRAARRNAERSPVSRLSPGILIAVGVVVVAGVGMAAGAALTGGGDEKEPKSKSPAAAAGKKSGKADPAKAQAEQLDKLLADSNNSRATVIRSVENIKSCKNLNRAASDLRAAAGQRNGLVNRLGKLETDRVPADAKLTAALTRAWKSSSDADNHYATWAGQVASKGKKGCRKGKARPTAHTGLGARSSGVASAAKKQAAGLWNPTAQKYGLKQRQFGQL